MVQLVIEGPTVLRGEIAVSGAKNSVSKLLTASMLSADTCSFDNVPHIGDTSVTREMAESLGARIDAGEGKHLDITTPAISNSEVPESLAQRNRLSIMMLAPLLHREGKATVPATGGDKIGPRPVDFHLDAYRKMGAQITDSGDVYLATTDGLKGADLTLPYPSVTATENILMAATLARGTTYIRNAAIEPEVLDLAMFLQKMGAIIDYTIDRTFAIEGVSRLTGATHHIMPDRLVSASLGTAAVASGGDVFVRGARQEDLLTFLNTLRRVGGQYEVDRKGIRFFRSGPLRSIALETTVHPGFMTDWQPAFAILLTQASGMSVIHETVFEDRFVYVADLSKMGADMELYETCLGNSYCRFNTRGNKHSAVIKGPTSLKGREIEIPDLRAGFSHLIAAIIAEGRSTIRGIEELDRGYEQIDVGLERLGARIRRECEQE